MIFSIVIPSLRTLANLTTYEEEQIEYLISNKMIEKFISLTKHEKTAIRKDSFFALSNIAASTDEHVKYMYSCSEDLIVSLNYCINFDVFQIKNEAIWVICNTFSKNLAEINSRIILNGIIRLIFTIINQWSKISAVFLECLYSIKDHFENSIEFVQNNYDFLKSEIEFYKLCVSQLNEENYNKYSQIITDIEKNFMDNANFEQKFNNLEIVPKED